MKTSTKRRLSKKTVKSGDLFLFSPTQSYKLVSSWPPDKNGYMDGTIITPGTPGLILETSCLSLPAMLTDRQKNFGNIGGKKELKSCYFVLMNEKTYLIHYTQAMQISCVETLK